MLFDPTPDTSSYMIAGYVFAFAVLGIYIFSLVIRSRNLQQDLETLESLQIEIKPKTVKPKKTSKAKPKIKSRSTRKK